MDSKLSALLAELYTLDPSLQEREAELIPIIEALLRARPDTAFDARFAAELRKKLLTPSIVTRTKTSMPMPGFNKIAFAGLGGLIALVIAIPVTYKLTQSGNPLEEFSLGSVSSAPKIQNLADDAFGTLSPTSDAPLGAPETRSSTTAYGMGGGGPIGAPAPLADGAEDTASSDKRVASDLAITEPYPGSYVEYTYNYTGEALDLTNISDAVYRQNSGLVVGNLGSDLTRAKFGPVDMSSFSGLSLQNFSVTQTDKNGYAIYVDSMNGSISINGNEGLWGYTSGNYTPLTEDQIMSNEDLIAAADQFIKKYDIDQTGFGAPVVDDRGLVYALSQPAGLRYLPDVMTVTYPLMLEGQPVYSSDGSAYGLYVMVSMRTGGVVSASMNLASSYDKSSYELERDSSKILALASQGGLYNYSMDGAEKVTIELGTPQLILINHYSYVDGKSETLFIPALSFPITKNSDTNPVYSDSVVIPLVKSVIDEASQTPIYRLLDDTPAPKAE